MCSFDVPPTSLGNRNGPVDDDGDLPCSSLRSMIFIRFLIKNPLYSGAFNPQQEFEFGLNSKREFAFFYLKKKEVFVWKKQVAVFTTW